MDDDDLYYPPVSDPEPRRSGCQHPRMESTARTDHCPDCGYEFYYGDAHATGEAQLSRLVRRGKNGEE